MSRSRRAPRLTLATLEDRTVPAGGALDPSFNADGMVRLSVPGTALGRMTDVLVDPDGRMVAAGWVDGSIGQPALYRFTPAGEPDPTFSDDGFAVPDLGGVSARFAAVARQPDGKLVAAGTAGPGAGNHVLVARFDAAGALDPTFGGGDGVTYTDIQSGDENGFDMAIGPDGKVVVVGNILGNGLDGFLVLRYTAAGELDETFSEDGWAYHQGGVARAVAIQPDGKIVAAGYGPPPGGFGHGFLLVRLDAAGAPDPTFSSDGVASVFLGDAGFSEAEDLALLPDGRLVAAGVAVMRDGEDRNRFAVAQFTATGELDPTFGDGGKVLVAVPGGAAHGYGLAADADGKLLVAGAGPYAVLMRLNADGTPDAGFGTPGNSISPGVVGTDVAQDDREEFRAVAVGGDGRIVAVGLAGGQAAAARYLITDPANFTPVAAPDAYAVPLGDLVVSAANGLLANDTDAEGDPLSVVVVRGSSNGRLRVQPDGSFTFAPVDSLTESTWFDYKVTDGVNFSLPTRVILTRHIAFTDGSIHVVGTDGPDVVRVRPGRPGEVLVTLTTPTWTQVERIRPRRLVTAVEVWLGPGDDGLVATLGRVPVTVYGGPGADAIRTGNGADVVFGDEEDRTGTGNDTIEAGAGRNLVHAGGGDNWIRTGYGADEITAGDGRQDIASGAGNDEITVGSGGSRIDAGSGHDQVAVGGGDNEVWGGWGNDVLVGASGADFLVGGRGKDLLVGGLGADELVGGSGHDLLFDGDAVVPDPRSDSLAEVLASYVPTDRSSLVEITGRIEVTFDTEAGDILEGGLGVDWFWTDDLLDLTDREPDEPHNAVT